MIETRSYLPPGENNRSEDDDRIALYELTGRMRVPEDSRSRAGPTKMITFLESAKMRGVMSRRFTTASLSGLVGKLVGGGDAECAEEYGAVQRSKGERTGWKCSRRQ